MNGLAMMAAGILLIVFSTIGTAVFEMLLQKKKKRIREQTYQIYD